MPYEIQTTVQNFSKSERWDTNYESHILGRYAQLCPRAKTPEEGFSWEFKTKFHLNLSITSVFMPPPGRAIDNLQIVAASSLDPSHTNSVPPISLQIPDRSVWVPDHSFIIMLGVTCVR